MTKLYTTLLAATLLFAGCHKADTVITGETDFATL